MRKTPLPLQVEGIRFLVDGGILLADDMGLGKTFQALRASADPSLDQDLPLLVVCPSVVMGGWAYEIEQEFGEPPVIVRSPPQKKIATARSLVVSADLAGRNKAVQDALAQRRYRAVIVDEAHYFANDEAERTKGVLLGHKAVIRLGERVWFLSGTPAPLNVGQLWPMITSTAPGRIGHASRADFETDYCRFKTMKVPGTGREIEVIAGNRKVRIPELRRRLKGWWLRRKKDVLGLPPKARRVVPLLIQNLSAYEEFLDSEEGQALREAWGSGDTQALAERDDLHMSRMLRLLGMMKAEAAVEYAAHLLKGRPEAGVILWFRHLDAMALAEAALKRGKLKYQRIDGSTPGLRRTTIQNSFQNGSFPILLAQMDAAGVGLTLTRAKDAVFAEAHWNPARNMQPEDRIYRIGQTEAVTMHYLAVYGTLDVAMQEVIKRRMEEWDQVDPANKRGNKT